jgi:hypothetical protein
MSFLKYANPTGAIADFRQAFRQAGKKRWWLILVAAAITAFLFSSFLMQTWYGPPAKPEITWITSYEPGRTNAEIVASNIENQKRKDAFAAEQAKREEEVREIYRKLGRASGMDVDTVDAEAKAERAAATAKRKREQAEVLERVRQAELAKQR